MHIDPKIMHVFARGREKIARFRWKMNVSAKIVHVALAKTARTLAL